MGRRTNRRAHHCVAAVAICLSLGGLVPLAPTGPASGQAAAPVVTSHIPYRQATTWDGQATELALDLYQPGGGEAPKGAFVWIHGGGFVSGSPRDPADVEIATRLARAGYVTASIEYRLGPEGGSSDELDDPDVVGRIVRAYEDAAAAVRFVRDHAADWGFDPDRVFVGGASAGGGTALNLAYLPGDHTDPTSPDRVAGAVSLIARTEPSLIEPGEAPMLMINGTEDTTVPLASAIATCDAAKAVGVPCEMITYEMGHGDPALLDPIVADVVGWLDRRSAELDAEASTTTSTAAAGSTPAPPAASGDDAAGAAPARPVAGSANLAG